MAMLDSVPVLKARLLACHVTQAGVDFMVAAGYDTLSKLAFCCTTTPGTEDSEFVKVLTAAYGGPVTGGELSCWRRAFFEAHTMMLCDLRSRTEGVSEAGPRKIPIAERAHRLEQQITRFPGLNLKSGELDLSHALVDLVYQMRDENALKYISAEVCTMRSQEINGVKKVAQVQTNAQGLLVVVTSDAVCTTDVSTDYQVRVALHRRGLALDRVSLLSYEKHEQWLAYLFNQMNRDVPDQFVAISLQHALQCDRQLFLIMSEATMTGIQEVNGLRPLDAAIVAARTDPVLSIMMMPMPKTGTAVASKFHALPTGRPGPPGAPSPPGMGKKTLKKLKAQAAAKSESSKGKGKGKGKIKGGMPAGLEGQHSRNPLGQSICFGFNLRSCRTPAGATCARGLHVCSKCFGSHVQDECPP